MTRVVLDTNIIVSALLQPTGPPARIFMLVWAAVFSYASGPGFMPSTKRSLAVPVCSVRRKP